LKNNKNTTVTISNQEKTLKNPKPSLNNLDQKLEKYLNFMDGFFIEAGANDDIVRATLISLKKSVTGVVFSSKEYQNYLKNVRKKDRDQSSKIVL